MINLNEKPRVGFAALAFAAESGGERGEDLTKLAVKNLQKQGLDVITPGYTVWNSEDAQKAVKFLKQNDIDLLVLLHCTWVEDSLQFQMVKGLENTPVFLWGVPYPETFSFATVQHISSILYRTGIFSQWGYGLPDEQDLLDKVAEFAKIAMIATRLRTVNIGLVGPRPTWRLAGPQDMVYDEWDLSEHLGINVIHLEIDDFLAKLNEISDQKAKEIVEVMKSSNRYGSIQVEEKRILHSAKVYYLTKEILSDYQLAGLAVECYPYYGGLVNLASAWLADEGIVLDPEGDVGHTKLSVVLNALQEGPTVLSELMHVELEKNLVYFRHEGSSAFSVSRDISLAEVVPADEDVGTVVQFPMRPMPVCTFSNLAGRNGTYTLYGGNLSIEELTQKQWRDWGGNFQAAAKFNGSVAGLLERAFSKGMDHHWLLKEGDLTGHLEILASIWEINWESLNEG